MIARARTLAVLRVLDPIRVSAVFRFLAEARLVNSVSLAGGDLRKVVWQKADLRPANLRAVNLREADLRGADLRGIDLSEANLRRVDLSGADLRQTGLRGANLYRANDAKTVWPDGFNPMEAGATIAAEKGKLNTDTK